MTTVNLIAPIAGWASPLTEVCDDAFSQGFVGDGIAIDPTEPVLRAPCDGIVVTLHRARHACTLVAAGGAVVLLHIGVDTVTLEGDGFVAHVADGQKVKAGDPLITFDMEKVAAKVPSLVTLMVIINGETHTIIERVVNREVARGESVMVVEDGSEEAPAAHAAPVVDETVSRDVRLMIAVGLHARPAAALASAACGHGGIVTITCNGRTANAKSVVSLLALNLKHGDTLTVSANGNGADHIVDRLIADIAAGLGDELVKSAPSGTDFADPTSPLSTAAVFYEPPFARGTEVSFKGTTAVPGVAIGPAVRLFHTAAPISEEGTGVAVESARLAKALAVMAARLDGTGHGKSETSTIFQTHRALLDDPDLKEGAAELIKMGKSAEWAWTTTVGRLISEFTALIDARMAERAADLRDLQGQVLGILTGRDAHATLTDFPTGSILVADDVLPSELTAVPSGRLAGICMGSGGATSHAVILAASIGIPTLVAAGPEVSRVPEGATLIIDGGAGTLTIFPSPATQTEMRAVVDAQALRHEENRRTSQIDCLTADGVRINVFANIGKVEDSAKARAEGAEGCGLLRTEFLFLGRGEAPSEDEQHHQYQAIADALEGRPVTIRTLDAGGDKPLAYFHIPHEENPALGIRGVRATIREPWLLRTQLRAILRVRPYGMCKVMVPMITSVAELRAVKAMIDEERASLGRAQPIEVGAMIEVPAAALTADRIAEEAAFFSIGTNDLTQYVLAMDRGNPALAPQVDTLHPGVLRLIAQITAGATPKKRTVAVCGSSASDPAAVPLLIGLGVTELSATPAMIADLKAFIRTLTLSDCRAVAKAAMAAESPDEVRRLVSERWPQP